MTELDELLDKAFTKLELVEIGENGNNVYRESKPFRSQITEAKQAIQALLEQEKNKAYKQGYVDGAVEEIVSHELAKKKVLKELKGE